MLTEAGAAHDPTVEKDGHRLDILHKACETHPCSTTTITFMPLIERLITQTTSARTIS